MKLSTWAKQKGISYKTAWNLYKQNKIENCEQLKSGTIIINETNSEFKSEYNVIYCRVSSSQNKSNLDSQAERLIAFCNAKGWQIHEVIKEVGSGLNDNRQKLLKLLNNKKITRIIVEHKDRLTRFGFNYIKSLFPGEIFIVNNIETDKQDLIQDFISVITSFCARIYGQRRCRRNTEKLIKELNNKENV